MNKLFRGSLEGNMLFSSPVIKSGVPHIHVCCFDMQVSCLLTFYPFPYGMKCPQIIGLKAVVYIYIYKYEGEGDWIFF